MRRFAVIMLLLMPGFAAGQSGWTWHSPQPQGHPLNAGTTWTAASSGSAHELRGVAFGPGRSVVVVGADNGGSMPVRGLGA
jgi:hypothetical protein